MIDYLRAEKYHGCPCKGCEEREIGCHGKCEKYIAWRKSADEKRAAEYSARNKGVSSISDSAVRKIWKKQRWSYQQTWRRSGNER